jgi:arginine/serine-rich splicing factor 4/5/6
LREIVLKNGFGFAEFEDSRDADDACYRLNGKDLGGSRVIVEPCRRGPGSRRGGDDYRRDSRRDDYRGGSRKSTRYGPPVQTRFRMVVENLSTRVSWQVSILT